jgi:uncharacterized damage-inducible protein DinB
MKRKLPDPAFSVSSVIFFFNALSGLEHHGLELRQPTSRMTIASEFIERSRHYLAYEYPTKIRRCLAILPADALWRRSDESSNSIGNLLLHLSGNIRQWIVSSVGGAPDHRQRSAEFAALGGGDAESLFAALSATLSEADAVLARLTPEDLETRRTIQGRDVTVLDAVYHVVEHFSLHTGQIILLTKQFAPGTIRFYEDAGGLAIPRWGETQ